MNVWATVETLQAMPLFKGNLPVSDYIAYTNEGGLCKYNIQCVKNITRDDIFNRLMKGRAYMDKQCMANPTIIEIARQSCLSKFHFCRQFKQAFGLSPYQYLLKKRLLHALQLLQQTDINLAQVATITGFSDIFTFSKAFKRQFNAAPSKLRGGACRVCA